MCDGNKLLKQIHETRESFKWTSLVQERMSDTVFSQNDCWGAIAQGSESLTEDEEGENIALMDWDECVKDEKGRKPRKGKDRQNRWAAGLVG